MDRTAAGRTALMSIRPRFASAILDGSKRIEFRKRRLADDVDTVVIYTTAPVKAVTGEFRIADQVSGTPDELWGRFGDVGGIDPAAFFDYYDGHSQAVGILIDDVTVYDAPRPLGSVDPGARPPQSFKYLSV